MNLKWFENHMTLKYVWAGTATFSDNSIFDNNISDDHFSDIALKYHISDFTIFPTHHISDMTILHPWAGVAGGGSPLIFVACGHSTTQSGGAGGSSPLIGL